MSSTYIPNIEGATAEEAGRNIIEFTKDCEKASGVFPITVERREYMDYGGRYGFILEHGRCVSLRPNARFALGKSALDEYRGKVGLSEPLG